MTLSYDSLYQAVLKMLEGFGIEAEQKKHKVGVVLVGEIFQTLQGCTWNVLASTEHARIDLYESSSIHPEINSKMEGESLIVHTEPNHLG